MFYKTYRHPEFIMIKNSCVKINKTKGYMVNGSCFDIIHTYLCFIIYIYMYFDLHNKLLLSANKY